MDQPSLYDDDIVTWSEQQAEAVRALARRPELSNALDWENVIEEIESVGRSHISTVESALHQVLAHVLKYLSSSLAPSTQKWRVEVVAHHAVAARNYRPAMRQRIDWDELWLSAMKVADTSLEMYGERIAPGLPRTMPFTPEELTAEGFGMDQALERLAEVLKRPKTGH